MQHRGLSREKRRFIGAMEEKESTEALSWSQKKGTEIMGVVQWRKRGMDNALEFFGVGTR
jgi:hypothetical protein